MNPIDTPTTTWRLERALLLSAYYLVIALFLITSFFPEARVWGVNWWAYLPPVIKYGLLLIGIAMPPVALYWSQKLHTGSRAASKKADTTLTGFLVPASLTIVLLSLAFVLFRGTTHFLGDGYQLLARLAEQAPSVKAWDKGASFLHKALFSLLSGPPDARALLSFQIISVVSGVGLLVGVALLSHALFERNLQRYLFFLGLASSGYMLLFFGYVENYALFITAVMLYTLVGLLAVKGKASPWWTLPPLVAALFLHLLAVTLLPSFLYILLRKSRIAGRLVKLSTTAKLLSAAALVVLLLLVYHYLRTNYYFFTFALLPIIPDRFTVENDILFSFKHITDIGNLLLLLVPGLPVFAAMLLASPRKGRLKQPPFRFLLVLLLSTLGAVYVLNPGIGMPRNWDLFSIAGVPLAVLCYFYACESQRAAKHLLVRASLAVTLGSLSLAPRVAAQVVPSLGIAHFKNYLVLDKIRNRNARRLLIDYYEQQGNTAAAKKEWARVDRDFPELAHHKKAESLMRQGKYAEALVELRQALDLNPLFYNVYGNLGVCYLNLGMLDSALVLLKIADGVNPYNASIINNIGTIYLRQGKYTSAKKYFLKSLGIDSTEQNAMVGLASVYLQMNQFDRSLYYVSKIYSLTDMPYDYFRQAGDAFLNKRAFNQAARSYEYALKRGLEPAYVRRLEEKFPQLKR